MTNTHKILVVYDIQCPACDYYCNLIRIRESVGELVLINARQPGPEVYEITAKGLDLDQGMVVKIGQEFYYGADAIHVLALMGTNRGLFNRLAYWLFRSKTMARLMYPILRSLRNLFLKMLGNTKINNLGLNNNEHF